MKKSKQKSSEKKTITTLKLTELRINIKSDTDKLFPEKTETEEIFNRLKIQIHPNFLNDVFYKTPT
jgi:hypothetical protein